MSELTLLHALEKVLQGLETSPSFEDAQLKLVAEIRELFSCEAVSISLVDDTNAIAIRKTLIAEANWSSQISLTVGEGILGDCLLNGKAYLCTSPVNDARFKANNDAVPGLNAESLVCAPLKEGSKTVGLIALHNKRKGTFSRTEMERLEAACEIIGRFISSLQVIRKLRVVNADLEASRWELIRSRNTLRNLVDNLPEAIYIIDRAYRLTAINAARSGRMTRSPHNLVGNLCYESLFERSDPCENCLVHESFFVKNITERTEREWQDDGEPLEREVFTYPIFDDLKQVTHAIIVEKDVTEKRRLEGYLAQSEKLAAVGQLAAGIAHEINNPLTVILANAQLMQRELPPDGEMAELIDLIYRAGSRALHSVRNLLNFARKEQFEFKQIDINETVERALEMLRHEVVSRGVQLVFEPERKPLMMLASNNHIQGVWLNLILNGMDATEPEKGIVRVSTSQFGNEIRVTITDNGQGIPPENLKRIFEPFFTTKEPERGTGLGLSVCHRVIKQHGGHILVDSEVGKGTAFTVVLPTY